LAITLADLGHLNLRKESERAYWSARLGPNRVQELAKRDAQRLNQETENIINQLDRQFKEGEPVPDPKIDDLRRLIKRFGSP
jgi:hypothetical protein